MSCLEQKLMVSLFKNRYFMARLQVVLKSRGYNGEGLSVWEGRTINRFAVEDMRYDVGNTVRGGATSFNALLTSIRRL